MEHWLKRILDTSLIDDTIVDRVFEDIALCQNGCRHGAGLKVHG